MSVLDSLGKRILVFDGAMGTMLQQAGLKPGAPSYLWNISNADMVLDVHRQYLQAGCDIIKTNTFGASTAPFAPVGYGLEEVTVAGVGIAKKAAAEFGGRPCVALDIGPTGKLIEPLGDLKFEEAYEIFKAMALIGEKEGADLVLIETMNDAYEMKAAVLAVKENTALPIFATLTFDERGKLLTGCDIETAVAIFEGLGVDALGLNCGLGPKQVKNLFDSLRKCCSIPIILNPNAGLPHDVGGETIFDVDPEEFTSIMRELASDGAWIVGGCCGTTPSHIAALAEKCRDIIPKPLTVYNNTVVSSRSKAIYLDKDTVIIGERINPTGKSAMKQALREGDFDYLVDEAFAQQDNGAHILDVNVGLPDINEREAMMTAVKEIQALIKLPLQIDTADPSVLESALRIYNGKALINSVNGERESMERVFPLAKKYGGVVVALTLDEKGIPETAEGRLEIAKRILKTAAEYGIEKKNLIFDTLTLTISAGQESAATTLRALKLLKTELGVKTSLGVSNVSFGLPQRDKVNSAFFALALQSGLDAAIINPNSQPMMDTYYAFRALSGQDAQCADYIGKYSGAKAEAKKAEKELALSEAIISGLKEKAAAITSEMVRSAKPLEIINSELIPALDKVGADYEKGVFFLPQLLMSAEAAKAAFEVLKQSMSAGEIEKRGTIIIATVKGDIHDIGKNIVKVMLENYGFEVIDLGTNVEPEAVTEAALRHNARLVGLSSLMTTTLGGMEETLQALRKAVPACRIMVGGAALSQEYADKLGADFYGKDAAASVRYAEEIFGA